MQNYSGEVDTSQVDLIDVLADIRLINVAEIEIFHGAVSFIEANYQEHKSIISPVKITALILNREDIPNLYATSVRGYKNQVLEFQNQFGLGGFKVREQLVPWALEQVMRSGLPQNLHEDLAMASKTARNSAAIEDRYLLEALANTDLANVVEFMVLQEAMRCIHAKYHQAARRINLSDVCALVLNHRDVSSAYATSQEEYEQLKATYIEQNQSQVNQIIAQVVDKIYQEGSEFSINHDSLVAVNFQRRKKITKAWNI